MVHSRSIDRQILQKYKIVNRNKKTSLNKGEVWAEAPSLSPPAALSLVLTPLSVQNLRVHHLSLSRTPAHLTALC